MAVLKQLLRAMLHERRGFFTHEGDSRSTHAGRLAHRLVAVVLLATLLCACGGGGDDGSAEPIGGVETFRSVVSNPMDPQNWEIGPIVEGENYSSGVPLNPVPDRAGWAIELPGPTQAAGSVHYVTMPTGSLMGKSRIRMRFRVDAAPGVRIVPRNFPERPSRLTLYFQRRGDNWMAKGAFEAYRWYASFSSRSPIQPGAEIEVEAPFDGNWTAVLSSTRANNPAAFEAAMRQAERIGFVLGGGDGAGHGVYATGPARLIVTSFVAE